MKPKKQPKSKLIRLPIETIEKLEPLRREPPLSPENTRPSYNAAVLGALEGYYRYKATIAS